MNHHHHEPTLSEVQQKYHGTLRSYLTGFVYSLILTVVAFACIIEEWPPLPWRIYGIVLLALIQATIQLRYFIKLGSEGKPHWQLIIFFFLVFALLVIAIGSLWVMFDLNKRLMTM